MCVYAGDAYSITGLLIALYVAVIVSFCCPQDVDVNFLRMLFRFCVLVMMLRMCVLKCPCIVSMVIPKIFGVCEW